MLNDSKLPKNLWAEAINYHVWIHNRVPTRALKHDKTPLELATGHKLDLLSVHPWGCKAWVKRLDVGKLEPRAKLCFFVGIDAESKGFRVYWPGKNQVSIEQDVYFNETKALVNDEALIEGETETRTIRSNSSLPQPSRPEIDTPSTQNIPIKPEIAPNDTKNPITDSATTQPKKPT